MEVRNFPLCKTAVRQTERQPVRTYRMIVISGSLFGLFAVFCTRPFEIIEWAVGSCLKADLGFLLLVESLRIGFIFHCILILVLYFLKFAYDNFNWSWEINSRFGLRIRANFPQILWGILFFLTRMCLLDKSHLHLQINPFWDLKVCCLIVLLSLQYLLFKVSAIEMNIN